MDTGFGTAYHDGTGFADCDPYNKGYRKCKEENLSKQLWCSECVYLYKNELKICLVANKKI